MWVKYQPNPCGRSVGDCAVRAVSKALGVDWEKAYMMLCKAGFGMCDMPSSDLVSSAVLRENGFERLNHIFPENYTVRDLSLEYSIGTYVAYVGGHVVTVKNGGIYDLWDSSNETVLSVWYRKE